jgi:hypothetical protein
MQIGCFVVRNVLCLTQASLRYELRNVAESNGAITSQQLCCEKRCKDASL